MLTFALDTCRMPNSLSKVTLLKAFSLLNSSNIEPFGEYDFVHYGDGALKEKKISIICLGHLVLLIQIKA